MKKILFIFAVIFMLSLVIAQESGGELTGKQNECIMLPQECPSCSYVNISSFQYPNMTRIFVNTGMTQSGTSFDYEFCNTTQIGKYNYCMVGDIDGTDTSVCKDFEITPTGDQMSGWSIALQIFASLSSLFLMILFLYLSGSKLSEKAGQEKPVVRIFFIGIALVFLIAHILITNVVIHNTLGLGAISGAYTSVMYIFFTIIILIFIYTLAKVTFYEIDIVRKHWGLK